MGVKAQRFHPSQAFVRKEKIVASGVRVRLHAKWWGRLLVIEAEPAQGFVHLVQNPSECTRSFGAYHISVAQWPVANNIDFNDLDTEFSGRVVTLPVDVVRNEGFLKLGQCPLVDAVSLIKQRPGVWYANREVHISA